jgi:hypothetical protein
LHFDSIFEQDDGLVTMATLSSIKKFISTLKASVDSDDAGAEPLRKAFAALGKSKNGITPAALKGFLEAVPSRDHNGLWRAIYHHVEVLVNKLAASTGAENEREFDLVGKRVVKVGENGVDSVVGSIVELVEEAPAAAAAAADAAADDDDDCGNEAGDAFEMSSIFVCRVEYEDGSEETFPVEEAIARIGDEAAAAAAANTSVASSEAQEGLSSEDVEALMSVATLALGWVNHGTAAAAASSKAGTKLEVSPAMHATLGLMHDILFELSGLDGLALREAIAKVCEAMWLGERKGAELLMAQLLPFLLIHALGDEARDADVKRIFGVRGALMLMDLDDPSSETLKGLLLRCVMHGRFLYNATGRNFLVFLFGLAPDFIEDIHATVKNQVPHATPATLAIYGDIYLKAWKESALPTDGAGGATGTNAYRKAIEGCVQELMQASVLSGMASTHKALRALLQPLHTAKHRSSGMAQGAEHDTMLAKLWEPILWRSLTVANATVREQATRLLGDAFPLQTFASPKAAENDKLNDALLQKQFDALRALLADNDPKVRVAAAATVAEVLAEYWEAIPNKMSRALITHFATKLVRDSTSQLFYIVVVCFIRSLPSIALFWSYTDLFIFSFLSFDFIRHRVVVEGARGGGGGPGAAAGESLVARRAQGGAAAAARRRARPRRARARVLRAAAAAREHRAGHRLLPHRPRGPPHGAPRGRRAPQERYVRHGQAPGALFLPARLGPFGRDGRAEQEDHGGEARRGGGGGPAHSAGEGAAVAGRGEPAAQPGRDHRLLRRGARARGRADPVAARGAALHLRGQRGGQPQRRRPHPRPRAQCRGRDHGGGGERRRRRGGRGGGGGLRRFFCR